MIVYLSGKYLATTREEKDANVKFAMTIAVSLWDLGYKVICPHTNSYYFDEMCQEMQYVDWLMGYLEILDKCDALILLPNYEDCIESTYDKLWAENHNIPVYKYPNLPMLLKNAAKA